MKLSAADIGVQVAAARLACHGRRGCAAALDSNAHADHQLLHLTMSDPPPAHLEQP